MRAIKSIHVVIARNWKLQSYSRAALTHNILPDTKEKIEFTFGLYMRTFYCDPTGLFFSMLEI